ncbi:MAG: tryptophan synthase subunit beta [Desulfobacterales bacterium SG8_35_2]|nr:MAG: tryptophan synthase subunit beta [Desulfobacterales bacterium SG8_35_2]
MIKVHQLSASKMPNHYYNIIPDLPFEIHPPLHPATKEPAGPQDLAAIFPMGLIEQEVSTDSEIPIPQEVLEIYRMYRPTPLIRANSLEKALDTPARIYYKYEGVSPVGSHKPNTAVAQAYYNKKEGIKRLVTETGAGQWGSALAFACQKFGLGCTVYMVKVSYQQKPYRKVMMHIYGAEVYPSPSNRTEAGRNILAKTPENPGSLGIAISEAIEEAVQDQQTNYSLGSVLNHVLLHQTVIGQEVKAQLKELNEKPDVIIACHGGGSNFAGLAFPFIRDKINGDNMEIIAVEPLSCPTLTQGKLDYDFGDTAGMTPLIRMYTLGHEFIPPSIHAGGLRYHGASPLVSSLKEHNLIKARAVSQLDVFNGAVTFAKTEGIVPAPEPAHAVEMVIREAKKAREEGKEKVILFNLCGHGLLDLQSYEKYLQGELTAEDEVIKSV